MLHKPLAQEIMRVAAGHRIQAGEPLPERCLICFCTNPETICEVLMELYTEGLLEEVLHEVGTLIQAGADHIW